MVERITFGDKEPGDLFTADMTDEIALAVNALGTAADANIGTTAGCVPALDEFGKLPVEALPAAILIPGSGDVIGPNSSTDGLPALWDGTSGKSIKVGTASQFMPAGGTEGQFVQQGASVPGWVGSSAIVTALEALTLTDRLAAAAIKDLDGAPAGALYIAALLAATGATAGQILVVNTAEDDFDVLTPVTENPTPATATQVAGAITLDFTTPTLLTTTSAAITAITPTNLALYSSGRWIVTFGGSHNITWTSTWKVPGGIAHVGTSGTTVHFIIYRASSTIYHVMAGANLVTV